MGLLLLSAGLALLVLPGAARPLGQRLAPAEWARLCRLALVAGAVLLELSLMLYAAPTVLGAVGIHALAEACERALGPLVPGGALAGWIALAAALAVPIMVMTAGWRARRSSRRVWTEPCLGVHSDCGAHELVELPTDTVVAVSVPSPTPQIIVSRGLGLVLAPHELRAVVDHERAHLELGHHRFLLVAAALERGLAFLPVGASARAMRAAIERWADETAAGDSPASRQALRSALLLVTTDALDPAVAAFSAADTVVERLDALARPPRPPSQLLRSLLYVPGALVGTAVMVMFAATAGSAQALLAVTGHCPL